MILLKNPSCIVNQNLKIFVVSLGKNQLLKKTNEQSPNFFRTSEACCHFCAGSSFNACP